MAKQICSDYSATMTKSDTNFDLRERSEIFSLEGKAEKLTIVYPALNLKGEFVNVNKGDFQKKIGQWLGIYEAFWWLIPSARRTRIRAFPKFV